MARDNNHHDVYADSGEKHFPLAKSSLEKLLIVIAIMIIVIKK